MAEGQPMAEGQFMAEGQPMAEGQFMTERQPINIIIYTLAAIARSVYKEFHSKTKF